MECSPGITREEALDLLRRNVKNESMIKHCHASEAVMVALAKRLGEDEKTWGLAGLLHDIDIEITGADLSEHGLKAVEILDAAGVSKEISLAIKMHNESAHGIPRSERFHHALAAGESITGLITATTLVYPDKKLASVKPSSVVQRQAFLGGEEDEREVLRGLGGSGDHPGMREDRRSSPRVRRARHRSDAGDCPGTGPLKKRLP